MNTTVQYILENKDWIFSGIGVSALFFLISKIWNKKRKGNSARIRGSNNTVQQNSTKEENKLDLEGDMNSINQY